jgi:hypothetical protein
VLTAKAREWKKQALAEIRCQLRTARFLGQYRLSVLLSNVGLSHDRDYDNALKLLLDAIVKSGAVIDDNHRCLRSIDLEWRRDLPPGTCRVVIAELSPLPISRPAKPDRVPPSRGMLQIGDCAASGVAKRVGPVPGHWPRKSAAYGPTSPLWRHMRKTQSETTENSGLRNGRLEAPGHSCRAGQGAFMSKAFSTSVKSSR